MNDADAYVRPVYETHNATEIRSNSNLDAVDVDALDSINVSTLVCHRPRERVHLSMGSATLEAHFALPLADYVNLPSCPPLLCNSVLLHNLH